MKKRGNRLSTRSNPSRVSVTASRLARAGKRVAVLDGSVQQSFLIQTAASFGVRPELVAFPDYRGALGAVQQGHADALVTNALYGSQHAIAAGLEDTAIIFAPVGALVPSG